VLSAAQTVVSTEPRTAVAALERADSAASIVNSASSRVLRVFHAAVVGPRLNATDAPASMFKLTAAAAWPPPLSHAMMKFLLL